MNDRHGFISSLGHRFVSAGTLLVFVICALACGGGTAPAKADEVFVRLNTDAGSILLVLYPQLAPHHANNFVHLSESGFLAGTYFHRIVPGFVIQGGDPNTKDDDPRNDGQGGPQLADLLTAEQMEMVAEIDAALAAGGYTGLSGRVGVKAEFNDTVKHVRGSLSMARSREPDSAGSQFFICVAATPNLDGQYTLFGHVVTGMDVADAIVSAPKDPARGRDAPAQPVTIQSADVIRDLQKLSADEQQAFAALPPELQLGSAQ